jgi:hypothetical protein
MGDVVAQDRQVSDERLREIAIEYAQNIIETFGDDSFEVLDDKTDGYWSDGDLNKLREIVDQISNKLWDNLH